MALAPVPEELASHSAGGGPRKQARRLVVARQGTPPLGPNDPETVQATVYRAEYDRQDCWTLSLPSAAPIHNVDDVSDPRSDRCAPVLDSNRHDVGPWHIRVYSVIDLDGSRSISPGLEPSAATILPGPNPEVTVSYVLKRPWLPGLPWSVAFRTEPPSSVVPPMVLVAHHRAVPLSVDDGQIVARFPAGRDGSPVPYPHAVEPLPVRCSGFSPTPMWNPMHSFRSASVTRRAAPRASETQLRDVGRSRSRAVGLFRAFFASFVHKT